MDLRGVGLRCSDATRLVGAHTATMRLGTSIMHMAARAPAATAMAALSLDHLSGGRFVLGLGVSGPELVEGWYGQPFDPPLGRTRDYVEIVRRVLRHRDPVEYQGRHLSLPLPGGSGLGRPFRSMVRPLRPDLPILLAAEGRGTSPSLGDRRRLDRHLLLPVP